MVKADRSLTISNRLCYQIQIPVTYSMVDIFTPLFPPPPLQGLLSQLERVTPAELDTLKQAVQEKEEEVGRLSSQLEAKETEKQKLLAQVERQSQQAADELVEVIGEQCELRSSLMEAEDGRMRAEVELEDLKSRKSVVSTLPVRGNCKICLMSEVF